MRITDPGLRLTPVGRRWVRGTLLAVGLALVVSGDFRLALAGILVLAGIAAGAKGEGR